MGQVSRRTDAPAGGVTEAPRADNCGRATRHVRILIATVTAGGGHLQAAAALEEAWTTLHPAHEVKRVDLLDLVPKLQRKMYAEGYVKLIAHAPELYELISNKTDNPRRVRELGAFRRRFAEHTNRTQGAVGRLQ